MIANEIAFGKSFSENILYNVRGRASEPNPHKSAWYVARNLITDDLDAAGRIMEATASSSRATKPVYHFSIDWDRSEERFLDKDKCIEVADTVLDKIGLAEHQALYFWHVDADHPHMHVVVNRVHEQTGKAWDMWKSKERLEIAAHEVARDMQFLEVPGRHNELAFEAETSREATLSREGRLDPLKPWNKEHVAAIKQDLASLFYSANDWQELSDGLWQSGLELRHKGQGLILTDGTHYTQLSKMGKHVRLSTLEEKFGEKYAAFIAKDPLEPVREDSPKWAFENIADRLAERINGSIKVIDKEVAALGHGHSNDKRISELTAVMRGMDHFDSKWHRHDVSESMKRLERRIEKQRKAMNRASALVSHHKLKGWELLFTVDTSLNDDKALSALKTLQKEIDALGKAGTKTPKTRKLMAMLIERRKKLATAKKKREAAAKKRHSKLEQQVQYRLQKLHEAHGRLNERKSMLDRSERIRIAKRAAILRNNQTREHLKQRSAGLLASIPKETILNANLPQKERAAILNRWYAAQELVKGQGKEKHLRPSRKRSVDRDPFDD